MNIELFFDPLDVDLINGFQTNASLFPMTSFYTTASKPHWEAKDIVIIGVPEIRGGIINKNGDEAPDKIREHLYQLYAHRDEIDLADLGNLRCGPDREDTIQRLAEVVQYFLSKDKFVIILGGTQDIDYGQFLGYQDLGHPINVLTIDSHFDLDEEPVPGEECKGHNREILLHEPNFLLGLSQLAYQSYFVSAQEMSILEKLNCDCYRLGKVRENIQDIEPVIRSADMISFDLSAVKMNDAPGNYAATNFGLTGEEACRLAWYAGNNQSLTSFGLYDFDPSCDHRGITAQLCATMIWYLIDGFYNRKGSRDFSSVEFTRFVVPMSSEPAELVFYKHKSSEQWWMDVQYSGPEKQLHKVTVPCAYSDFQSANEGNIPDRWILTNSRHS